MPMAPKVPPLEEVYLDFYATSAELEKLGFGKVTYRQVRRMADQGKLPFFRGMDGRRYIGRSVLHAAMRQRQDEAAKECAAEGRRKKNWETKGWPE